MDNQLDQLPQFPLEDLISPQIKDHFPIFLN
jgi:hypothetical protein